MHVKFRLTVFVIEPHFKTSGNRWVLKGPQLIFVYVNMYAAF